MNIAIGCYYNKTLFDPDYETNVLDVANTLGYPILKYKTLQYQNRLMKDMKNIGFYQIQDTLANFAIGSLGYDQFGMVDWKKMGNIYTPFGGLIYNPEGVQGNGVNAYINTNFNPAAMGANYTLNDASLTSILYSNTGAFNASVTFSSSATGAVGIFLRNNNSQTKRINQGDTNLNGIIDFTGNGLKCLNRTSSIDVVGIDRDVETHQTRASVEVYNSDTYLFARSGEYAVVGANMAAMGAAIPYPMSQSFREIYNQYLSNIGLDPIA